MEHGVNNINKLINTKVPRIYVGISNIYLSPVEQSDKEAFLEHFNERKTTENLHTVPFPFTEMDATRWITFYEENRVVPETKLAIRDITGRLIGEVGIRDDPLIHEDGCEIGYWLARPWWNRGIMTAAVQAFASYALEDLGLLRIYAKTPPENIASQRVLKKAKFTLQNICRSPDQLNQNPSNNLMFVRRSDDAE